MPFATLLRQVLLLVLATVALTLGAAAAAAAHTSLSSTSPEDGAELAEAPQQVVLEFTGEVIELGAAVAMAGPAGQVQAGPPTVSGSTVTADLPRALAGGQYEVEWRVASADGHPLSGSFSFSVVPDASDGTTAAGAAETGGGSAEVLEGEEAGSSTAWLIAVPGVVVGLVAAAVVAVLRNRRER